MGELISQDFQGGDKALTGEKPSSVCHRHELRSLTLQEKEEDILLPVCLSKSQVLICEFEYPSPLMILSRSFLCSSIVADGFTPSLTKERLVSSTTYSFMSKGFVFALRMEATVSPVRQLRLERRLPDRKIFRDGVSGANEKGDKKPHTITTNN